jgi:hypothetical protein
MEGEARLSGNYFVYFLTQLVKNFTALSKNQLEILKFYIELEYDRYREDIRYVPYEIARICTDPELQGEAIAIEKREEEKRTERIAKIVERAHHHQEWLGLLGYVHERKLDNYHENLENYRAWHKTLPESEHQSERKQIEERIKCYIASPEQNPPPKLIIEPRLITFAQIKMLKAACLQVVSANYVKVAGAIQVIKDFVAFCYLLHFPENHVKTKSSQYIEKEVKIRSHADMAHEKSQELMRLPRYHAAAKLGDSRFTIKTEAFETVHASPPEGIEERAEALGYTKHRATIQAATRARRESWRLRNEPPPDSGGLPPTFKPF